MRLVVALGCLMGLLAWMQAALAQQAWPELPPGWQRIDAHTLRRTDIANAAARWERVDAHRWQLLAGEAPRAVASR